jgi:hypothetical protein
MLLHLLRFNIKRRKAKVCPSQIKYFESHQGLKASHGHDFEKALTNWIWANKIIKHNSQGNCLSAQTRDVREIRK